MDVPVLVLCFGALLVVGVLISELAHRTVISTAVLFLLGGFLLGPGLLDVLHVESGNSGVSVLAELALFTVLYSDGMKVGIGDLRKAWRLPGRALLLGLPLTLVVTAAFAHWVAGLPWLESFLLGAVLSPTDPVFASAIVGRTEVPYRLRHLLNVESGVNAGLALPIVLVLLAAAGGGAAHGWGLAEELALGIAIGLVVPYVVLRLERLPFLAATRNLEPLLPAAIGLVVLGLSETTHANLFLAAFTAGITVASMSEEFRHQFEQLGELVAEQLKLVAILVFGALMTPAFLFHETPWAGWIFAVLALVVARPAALLVSFLGSKMDRDEQLAASSSPQCSQEGWLSRPGRPSWRSTDGPEARTLTPAIGSPVSPSCGSAVRRPWSWRARSSPSSRRTPNASRSGRPSTPPPRRHPSAGRWSAASRSWFCARAR